MRLLLEPCERESGKSRYEGWFWGSRSKGQTENRDSDSEGSFASHSHTWQDPAASLLESSTSLGLGYLCPRRTCSGSLTGDWRFRHRIRFPCGRFVSTFYSFKESDNIGGERYLGPRTRIEFPMKTANYKNLYSL